MIDAKFKVTKDIEEGWEVAAKAGDILTVGYWEGDKVLMKDEKAVCDVGSRYYHDNCEIIKEGAE